MQVEAEVRTPPANHGPSGAQDVAHIGVSFEERLKPLFHHHRNFQIRPCALEQGKSGSGENAIAHGANSDHRDSPLFGDTFEDGTHAIAPLLLLNAGFVDQHHRNIITNRVHAMALDALQPAGVRLQLDRRLAERAHQNLQ